MSTGVGCVEQYSRRGTEKFIQTKDFVLVGSRPPKFKCAGVIIFRLLSWNVIWCQNIFLDAVSISCGGDVDRIAYLLFIYSMVDVKALDL